MSQQYPLPPPNWPQYANNQYYPDYNAGAPAVNSSPGISQQSTHHPNLPSSMSAQNQQRYETNAQIPVAPIPFQFPPNLDPTLFKQFGGHVPPPPPPPNFAAMAMPSMNAANLAQNTHAPNFPSTVDHNYRPAGVTPSPYRGALMYSIQGFPPQTTDAELGTASSGFNQPLKVHRPVQPAPSVNNIQPPHPSPMSGTGAYTSGDYPVKTANTDGGSPSSQLQAELAKESNATISHPASAPDETRERAKAAILSLAASGISFQDLSREGVHPGVLSQLFDELGLEKPAHPAQVEVVRNGVNSEMPKQSSVNQNTPSTSGAEAPDPLTVNPGMERKDRIARLLAARNAQGNSNRQTSKSASPAATLIPNSSKPDSTAANQKPQPDTVANLFETDAADKNTLSKIAAAVNSGQHSTDEIEALHKSLPTPLQKELEQSGIPGLFMTSADLQDDDRNVAGLAVSQLQAQVNRRPDAHHPQPQTVPPPTSDADKLDNPRKRTAAAFDDTSFLPSKRASIEPEETADVEMELSRSEDDNSEQYEEGEYEPDGRGIIDIDSNLQANNHDEEMSSPTAQGIEPTRQLNLGSQTQGLHHHVVEKNQYNIEPPAKVTATSSNFSPATESLPSTQFSWPSSAQRKEASAGDKSGENLASPKGPRVDQGKLAARMAALKADLVAKNSRKRTLQEGMPALDAEVQKTRIKLEQIRKDLAKIQMSIEVKTTELEQAKSSERDLFQEIKLLECQLEDGLTGQKQFSSELSHLNDQIIADEKTSTSSGTKQPKTSGQLRMGDNNTRDGVYTSDVEAAPFSTDSGNVPQEPNLDFHSTNPSMAFNTTTQSKLLENSTTTTQMHDQHEPPASNIHEAEQDNNSPQEDSALSSANTNVFADSGDEQMSLEEDEGENEDEEDTEGSASMSNSGSENYEPEETGNEDMDNEGIEDSEGYEPEDVQMEERGNILETTDGDDYDPSEEVDVLDTNDLESLRKENDFAAPVLSTQAEAAANGIEVSTLAVQGQGEQTAQISAPSDPTGEDDREQGLSLTEANTLIKRQDADLSPFVPLGEEKDSSTGRFVPYRSPLTPLKSFRFHPQFNDLVKSGYRSLTYSNQIDAKRPLCPTELNGEVCTDATCEEQHFGSMALSDDKILVQMSSANDLKDKAQRDAYLIGLKKVIADLRERGVKEFSEVADALSKYRREWMEAQLASVS